MDSDFHHHQQQQQQMNSGLTRYRSAPSSYFVNLINSGNYGAEDCDDEFLNPPRVSSPETEQMFSRFMSSGGGGAEDSNNNSQNLCDTAISQNSLPNDQTLRSQESQFTASMKHEPPEILYHPQQQQQQLIYQQSQSQMEHKSTASSSSIMDDSYRVMGSSMAMDCLPQMNKMSGSKNNPNNLIRHSSSPAGLFANINFDNGYAIRRGMGNFGVAGGTKAEASFSSASRLKGQMDFSSGPSSSSGLMARVPETGGKRIGTSSPEGGSFNEDHRNDSGYITGGFPSSSWDDSTLLSENFLKGLGEHDRKTFSSLNSSENQNKGQNHAPTVLSHQLSLPTSSAELSAMENLLQFQDSVPLKIRAKRGCATHPRSIAERVRRTRISERMRKLQELVPNMDKQTNTADMLDLAVDYIKDLQKLVKTLSDNRAKCTCSNKQRP